MPLTLLKRFNASHSSFITSVWINFHSALFKILFSMVSLLQVLDLAFLKGYSVNAQSHTIFCEGSGSLVSPLDLVLRRFLNTIKSLDSASGFGTQYIIFLLKMWKWSFNGRKGSIHTQQEFKPFKLQWPWQRAVLQNLRLYHGDFHSILGLLQGPAVHGRPYLVRVSSVWVQ